MKDEQTNKTDTQGKKPDTALEKDGEDISEYDKALSLVKRREEVTKIELEVLAKKEKMATNEMLSGTSGGHVDAPVVSPEDKKKAGAKEFFKGTELEKAIDKI